MINLKLPKYHYVINYILFLLSALQLFVSFGLLNYFSPLLPLLRPLFPIGHSHLPQIIPHIVFPSYPWPSLRSCCIRFPFVYGLGHLVIGHSFYMPQPAQSFVFYVNKLHTSTRNIYISNLHESLQNHQQAHIRTK